MINGDASDPDGSIIRVEIYGDGEFLAYVGASFTFEWTNVPAGTHEIYAIAYDDGVLLNTDTSAPYNYYWYPTSRGTQSLTAKAYDNAGAETTSDPVTVRVR